MDELLRKVIELGAYSAQLEDIDIKVPDVVGEYKAELVYRILSDKYNIDDEELGNVAVDHIKRKVISLVDEIIESEAM
ncbi:hypothetical protein [Aneurinibacillus migulanus]|uniref:hypothetical protein n=1 Tax=Aneurinibacillus migulanus TaxID=47500 RepID=UPI00209DB7A2|nr:hypothetical protein [Aneurinibacillus migulanus]MCP1354626.1 hypothetical protein [Aneurinibacillus migulanus]